MQEEDRTTKACIRCGRWHSDAEIKTKRAMSCSEVKGFWANIRREHYESYGHYAMIGRSENGTWMCLRCNRALLRVP